MQIPIKAGVYVAKGDVRIAYPVNMQPVAPQDSATDGHLRYTDGIKPFTTGQGSDRGAFVWNDTHFRVSGTSLISIDAAGVVTVIGAVGGTGPARMDKSFDRLGILANNLLYYWDGISLTHVTDPNIPATLIDMGWVDGYWMVTDGTYLVVTNLNDPTTVNALKYGSTDRPDPVKCLLKVQNQMQVISRHFIDVFQNVGGAGFPFARVDSAVISKGAIGKRTACVFMDTVAFIGSGVNEAPGVYKARNAQTIPISTPEIDKTLLQYTESQLSTAIVEAVVDKGTQLLFCHLPDRSLVYDEGASVAAQQPIWHIRASAIAGFSQYKAQNILRVNDNWIVGDPASSAIGVWSSDTGQHYGTDVRWEFSTPMLRNGGKGANISQMELFAIRGPVAAGLDPRVSTSYSVDGEKWSQDKSVRSGKLGETTKRLVWLQQGDWRNFRIQRFRGDSGSRLSILGLDAEIELLKY